MTRSEKDDKNRSILTHLFPAYTNNSVEEKFSTLLKSFDDARSPESAQAAARHLSDLLVDELPKSAGESLQKLKKYIQTPAWKRERAAEIAEILIFRLNEPKNPISPGLKSACGRLFRNIRNSQSPFAIVVGGLSQLVALIVLALLWPYGQLFKAMDAILRLMKVSKINAEFRASTGFERFPYLLEVTVYFIIFSVVFLLCIPFICLMVVVESIGKIVGD